MAISALEALEVIQSLDREDIQNSIDELEGQIAQLKELLKVANRKENIGKKPVKAVTKAAIELETKFDLVRNYLREHGPMTVQDIKLATKIHRVTLMRKILIAEEFTKDHPVIDENTVVYLKAVTQPPSRNAEPEPYYNRPDNSL